MVDLPTAAGVTVIVRAASVPVIEIAESGTTAGFEDVAATVNWSAVIPGAASPTVIPRVSLAESPSAAGRPACEVVMVGLITGGVMPPPLPITVPGANATPRAASFAGRVAMTVAVPVNVPPTPEVSVIFSSTPDVPAEPALVANTVTVPLLSSAVSPATFGTDTEPSAVQVPAISPYFTTRPLVKSASYRVSGAVPLPRVSSEYPYGSPGAGANGRLVTG